VVKVLEEALQESVDAPRRRVKKGCIEVEKPDIAERIKILDL
jgi:hypothetical protein